MTAMTGTAAWSPDKVADLDLDAVLPDSLLVETTTKAGEVEGDEPFIRVPFVGADPTASVVAEGQAITPDDADLDEVAFRTVKVATLSKVSNELFRIPGNQPRLLASLQRAVLGKVNAEFVKSLETASTGFVDGGVLGGDFDAFSDVIADVEANGGDVSHFVMPSTAWKTLAKIKASTGSNVPILGVGDASTDGVKKSIFGVPVRLSAEATAVYAVSREDLVSAYSALRVSISEDAYFGEDAVGMRSTLRFGVAPARPNRHARIALA